MAFGAGEAEAARARELHRAVPCAPPPATDAAATKARATPAERRHAWRRIALVVVLQLALLAAAKVSGLADRLDRDTVRRIAHVHSRAGVHTASRSTVRPTCQ